MKFSKQTISTALTIAVPAMIESFFVAFAGFLDSMMVGSLGTNAVAAVGLTTQPKFVGLSVFFAINVSISALVARRYGEKDRKSANSILATALILMMALVALISTLCVVFAPHIMNLCGSTPETHENAVIYYRIIMGGMLFNCLQMTINAAQRGAGNTKITMRTNIVSNTVNVIFNYLLIGGNFGFPALGITGAAIATVLGTVVSSIMSIASISKKTSFVSIIYIAKEKIKPAFDALKSIVKVGYSVFFEQILLRIGFMSTAIMAAEQGNAAMAVHQVGMNVLSLSFAFGDGLQAAAVALIGKNLGEKNPEMAKTYGKVCQMIGTIISIVMAVVYSIGAKTIMGWFFYEPDVITLGVSIMFTIIPIVLFQIKQVIYMGCLRGAGDTLYTAVVSAISVAIVRTLGSYVFCYVFGFGIVGIWIGILIDQVVRITFAGLRFKAGKWVNIKI